MPSQGAAECMHSGRTFFYWLLLTFLISQLAFDWSFSLFKVHINQTVQGWTTEIGLVPHTSKLIFLGSNELMNDFPSSHVDE